MRPSTAIELALSILVILYVLHYISTSYNYNPNYSFYIAEDIYPSLLSLESSQIPPEDICSYLKLLYPNLEFEIYNSSNLICLTGTGIEKFTINYIYLYNNSIYNLYVTYYIK